MSFLSFIGNFFDKNIYNAKWRCLICGKEIFNDEYLCDDCKKILPYNSGPICGHCGRKTLAPEPYCSTCKGIIVSVDRARSVFNYEKPINRLIKNAKYDNCRYILDYFAEQLSLIYFKNFICADYVSYVPMTNKREKKRGYNQSKILAEKFSEIVKIPVFDGIVKSKETLRQAKLKRKDRLTNLIDAFKVVDKKKVKDKTLILIDDVSTTGSTGEAIANKLKKSGVKEVILLTVASVPPKDLY